MSRPLVRTEVVDEGLSQLLKDTFGTAAQAYKVLAPSLSDKGISWYVFQRAFVLKPVEKRVVLAMREATLSAIETLSGWAKSARKEWEG